MNNRELQISRQSAWKLINQEYKDDPECCFAFGFEAGYHFAVAPRVEPPAMESGGGFESLPAKSKITPNAWRSRVSQYESEAFDIVQPGLGAIALVKNEQFALLIAAAPDLLKALEECRNAIQGGASVEPYDSRGTGFEQCFGIAFVEHLNAVIIKAKGGAA